MIDPEIAEALSGLPLDNAELTAENLGEWRDRMEALLAVDAAPAGVERVAAGDPPVTLRLHGAGGQARPCIYWIHGGGLVLGDSRMGAADLAHWSELFDCVAVSVEYRLAPEHPYPAALDDCYAGLAWVVANAAELGVDPERIGVAGSSSGGGLAAALALRARDRGEIPLAFQLLLAPMLDDRQQTRSSRREDVPTWPPAANRFGWRSYLGPLYGGDVPAEAAPARAEDLSGLPRAFLRVGGADCFVDEVVEYARRLIEADVPTELHVYPGAPHGFETLAPGTTIARRARRDVEEWLAATLYGRPSLTRRS